MEVVCASVNVDFVVDLKTEILNETIHTLQGKPLLRRLICFQNEWHQVVSGHGLVIFLARVRHISIKNTNGEVSGGIFGERTTSDGGRLTCVIFGEETRHYSAMELAHGFSGRWRVPQKRVKLCPGRLLAACNGSLKLEQAA